MSTRIQPLPLPPPAQLHHILPQLRDCLAGHTPPLLPLPPDSQPTQRLRDALVGRPAPGAALIMATSGTTGHPKGAALSAAALRAACDSTHTALGGPGQWLLAVPAHHIIGMQVLLRSLHADHTPVVLPIDNGFRLETLPAAIDNLCESPGRHYASLVPSQLHTILTHAHSANPQERNLGQRAITACRQLDAILSGGAPLPHNTATELTAAGLTIVPGYGCSEVGGGVLFDGIPGPATTLHIDPTTHRISIGGATLAEGYIGTDDTSSWSRDKDGNRWFHTHDLGHYDHTGRIIIDGRLDEAINSGGITVIPQPLETLLRAHPAIADCAIVGLPHPQWGQQVTAIVVPSPDPTHPAPTLEELQALVEPHYGRYSIPRALHLVTQLPQTSTGKIDRHQLAHPSPHLKALQ